MVGLLTQEEIREILKSNTIGRIACSDEEKPYIVPVSYLYDGDSIIAHSQPGMKIQMMRKNPRVCFAVDEIKSFNNWKSVITWGKYQEISDDEEKWNITQQFLNRMMHLKDQPNGLVAESFAHAEAAPFRYGKTIIYRIVLHEMAGRFEV
ncbi:MAG: pyridoxamine 5'-phosphate oxidase family protein [Flavisolibacter sp.]|nr:pyridoxamine 5'-phosphate oxidase family protein [Flavisolibacter sp.]